MALELGTNCGFVPSVPAADPAEADGTMSGYARALKDTSPATAAKIVEIGWWCDNATDEANFEVGLYDATGSSEPGEAGDLLEVERTNAKGTDAGWKRVTVDWDIDPSTAYHIAVQLDYVGTTYTNYASSGGNGYDSQSGQSTLPDPFNGGLYTDGDGLLAIYAVWEAAAGGTVPFGGIYGKALSGSLGGRGV